MIRSITLSGFRGVVHPMTVGLLKDGKPTSLMIFGRNGTGKSSITDGWEWFHTGTIQHLAREGAKASAYPSRLPGGAAAPAGFVEITFQDAAGGTVRQALGGGRAAATTNAAGLAWLRERTTHPCHIRFEDLNRFVYLTKTERFDALAELMGFKEQVELQKQLRRVETKVAEKLAAAHREHGTGRDSVIAHFKLEPGEVPTERAVIDRFAQLFARHSVSDVATIAEVQRGLGELTTRVEHDARAKELKDIEALARCLERLEIPDLGSGVDRYASALTAFRAEESAMVADMLLGLYQRGEAAVVRQREETGAGKEDACPLCGQAYAGDLLAHIKGELHALGAVRVARDVAEQARADARIPLPAKDAIATAFARGVADAGAAAGQFDLGALQARCGELDRLIATVRPDLDAKSDEHSDASAQRVVGAGPTLAALVAAVIAEREALRSAVTARASALADDGARALLVADHAKVVRGLELWGTYRATCRRVAALVHCHDEYQALVERYVAMNIEDVETRFAAISADVDRYFDILEASTQGVAHPALKLLRDQERAVILEIEFGGERISPAYSYLSESQLNSFGLAVFLASVRHVNRDFRVVVLDDVVNSFDAYKRPQMIRLLKQEFSDFQIIVLTHDDVWWTQLIDQCPQWARLKIKRYEPGIGPISETAKSELEQIEAYLRDDEPTQAARTLGPMLERKLQSLCEAMQVSVTYNARNEYTLRPLLQCVVSRAKEKLGELHPLYLAAKTLEENTTFRNFSAHWKNPASGLTTPEVREVLDQWLHMHALVSCMQPKCGVMVAWRGDAKHFACSCGSMIVTKSAATALGSA